MERGLVNDRITIILIPLLLLSVQNHNCLECLMTEHLQKCCNKIIIDQLKLNVFSFHEVLCISYQLSASTYEVAIRPYIYP